MFVSKRRWILKTCGNTTPLQCLEPLLEMAEEIGYTDVEDLFYSRKNFKRPELQVSFKFCFLFLSISSLIYFQNMPNVRNKGQKVCQVKQMPQF